MKNGKAGTGKKHALYVAGQGKYADRSDVVLLLDGNLPKWAIDGADFFAAADEHERANGRSFREIEFAIPRGVDPVAYAKDYTNQVLGESHAYRLAVHSKAASDGGLNEHGHLMFSERKLDGIERGREQFFKRANTKNPERGGVAKDRSWNDRSRVQELRRGYEAHAKTHGVDLDLRSNKAQGLGPAEPKIGPAHPRSELNKTRRLKIETATTLREEREHGRKNRAAIFGRIRKNLSAADRAGAFSRDDHSGIAQEHRAIEAANRGIEQAIQSTRHHEAARAIATAVGAAIGGAVPQIARAASQIETHLAERALQEAAKAAQERQAAQAKALAEQRAQEAAKAEFDLDPGSVPVFYGGAWMPASQAAMLQDQQRKKIDTRLTPREEKDMATQKDHELAAQAMAKRRDNPNYRPTLQELRATTAVVDEGIQKQMGPNERARLARIEAIEKEKAERQAQAAAAQVETSSPSNPIPAQPGQQLSFAERLAESFRVMMAWIGEKLTKEYREAQPGGHYIGKIVHKDDLHAVQDLGQKSTIHQVEHLDKAPEVGAMVSIKYDQQMRGHVTPEKSKGQDLGR